MWNIVELGYRVGCKLKWLCFVPFTSANSSAVPICAMLKMPKCIQWVHAFEIEVSGGDTWKGVIVLHAKCFLIVSMESAMGA